MRYHKRVQLREMHYGAWYQAFGVMQKVVEVWKNFPGLALRGDLVAHQLSNGKWIKDVVEKIRMKDGKIFYLLSGLKDEIRKRKLDPLEAWVPVEEWAITRMVDVPLQEIHKTNMPLSWKGKWGLIKSSVVLPVDPGKLRVHVRVFRPDGSYLGVKAI